MRLSHTALYLPPFFGIVRVYVCSLLAMSVPALVFFTFPYGPHYRRLNSRNRIRAKLAADALNGIMVTMPTRKFAPDSNPGGNTSDIMTEAVADPTDLGSTDPTSQVIVRLVLIKFYCKLTTVLTCRISPKSGVTVHCHLRCSHDTTPNPSCTIYLGSRTSQDTCRGHPYIEVYGFTGRYLC